MDLSHDATATTNVIGSAEPAAAATTVDDDAAVSAAAGPSDGLGPPGRAPSTGAGSGPAVSGPAELRFRRDPIFMDRGLAALDGGKLYPHVL